MLRVGLTGGYATGKTFVAAELARLGCTVISADALGRQTLEPDGVAYDRVRELFGDAILDGTGRIDRRCLAAIVFSQPEMLKQLNEIVHPEVFRMEQALMEEAERRDSSAITVVEAAILIETGRYRAYDRIVLTLCDEAVQIARGMARDGLSADEVRARLKQQMPIAEKIPHAHYLVDTSGTRADTVMRVESVYRELCSL